MKYQDAFSKLSNDALLAETSRLAAVERHSTARLIAALAEVDGRRLYLGEGFSSLFTYCVAALRLSDHAAYGRIGAARAARRYPVILQMLEEGSLTLTSVTLLARHLTPENHRAVLAAARFKRTREVERQVAALRPQPDVPASVRKLPSTNVSVPAATLSASLNELPVQCRLSVRAMPLTMVKPLTPERYKVQFTVSRETYEKLRYAQALLRHTTPHGDVATIFDRALSALVAELEKKKLGMTDRLRPQGGGTATSRHIPATVRRAVWQRDGGQCAFVGSQGRCDERGFLEFHHVKPYAAGGAATVQNIELRCRAHNAYEADLFFVDSSAIEEKPAGQ